MATPVQVTVILWVLSPILSFLVNKLLSYLDFHLSRKLRELERQIIPSLEKTLADVTEQRMLRGAKDEGKGSESHLQILGELAKDLRSALYDADDVLDLVKYRQTEKKVISGHGNSVSTSISRWQRAQKPNQKLSDLGDKLQEHAHSLRATLMQCAHKLQECAQSLHLYIHQGAAGQPPVPAAPATEFRLDIEQETATPSPTLNTPSTSNPPTPNALPNSAGSTTGFSGGNQHGSAKEAPTLDAPLNSLLQKTWDRFGFVVSWLRSIYLVLRRLRGIKIARDCFGFVFALFCYFYLTMSDLRDWSYKPVGIKNDDDTATDWVLSINEIISLRKRINNIEYIVSESKKSCLLNQNSSSSSTSKDADKESSSSCTVKNSSEQSTCTQKEMDDVYRSIEKKVFGRDEARTDIIRMLRKEPDTYAASASTSKPYSVIGIYGITGSGKTTLAEFVCKYENNEGHFNPIMFIRVGKTFRVEDIFRDMLKQITPSQPPNGEGLQNLKTKLEEKLKGKRFLLVLDDLWVNDDMQNGWEWDILRGTLSAARSGSRVLVTAQKADAAGALGAHLQPFSIPDLEEKVYLSLLMRHAGPFATDDEYRKYENIGRKIANRLCRSPVAAVTVGKQLQRNKSISFWERTANLEMLNKTMGALWWSYQQLGVDVSRCFAYCSTFPKGYRLERDELVRIWIAQGFVNTRSNETEKLEDIGQSYFDQLLTFSFLQVHRTIFGTESGAFTIHDLLHELAERVSGSEFFRIGLNGSPEDIPRGVHHLFIETTNGVEIAEKLVEVENLCTLIIKEPLAAPLKFTNGRNHDSERLLERLFTRLTKLRVLIIKQNGYAEELSVPACIDRMKHLRYLGLRFCRDLSVLILPSTFSKLYHIEIIDIPLYTASCPEDMANLIDLRHIPDWLCFPNIGRLTSLRTMRSFIVEEEQGYGLKQLKHLNKLGGTLKIEGLGIVGSKEEALEAHLTHKERLRSLELKFGWDWEKRFGPDVEVEVLEGLCPPKHIGDLHIQAYRGSRYPSWMLSRHHPDALKQLHRLELCDCSQLASIPEGSELFIGLRELWITFCDWDSLPENMERLVSLQKLKIFGCKKMELLLTTPPQALNKKIDIYKRDMLRNIRIMDCSRLEFVWEKEKRLQACTSLEYCQDTAPTGTPEQSPYPMIPCPCLVNLEISLCANLVTLQNLPPSLKDLIISQCGELCYVSGQLDGLERLHIDDCNKLQSVDSLGDASSLKTLYLSRCQCLTSLGSSGGPGSYLALRGLQIEHCPAMDMKQFNKNVLDGLLLKEISDPAVVLGLLGDCTWNIGQLWI